MTTPRLPQPGGDEGNWGEVLNDFLSQSLASDGRIKPSAVADKEPTVTAGTTGQFYRGDKSWQTLDKSAVGLENVSNTSDAAKPISTATQVALNTKAAVTSLATEFYTTWATKANGASTTAADSGQTIVYRNNGTGAAQAVLNGMLQNTGSGSGTVAAYGTVDLGATVNRIGCRWVFFAGASTEFGELCMAIATQNINTTWPSIPNARAHFVVTRSFCQFAVYDGTAGSPVALVPLGGNSVNIYFDSPIADDGTTVHEAEIIFDNDTALLRTPDGRFYKFKDSRIASWAGNFPWWEPYQLNASTDSRIGIIDQWASTASQKQWMIGALEGLSSALVAAQVRVPWAKRTVRPLFRTDPNCVTTNGSASVTDAAITAADFGRPVTGTGIPASSFIGTVTPGVGFLLSSTAGTQTTVTATASGTVSLGIGTVSLALTTSYLDVDYALRITAPSIPASGQLLFTISVWIAMPTTPTRVLIGLRRSTSGSLLYSQAVLDTGVFSGQVTLPILLTNLTPTFSPTIFIVQASALAAGSATLKIGSGGFVATFSVQPA